MFCICDIIPTRLFAVSIVVAPHLLCCLHAAKTIHMSRCSRFTLQVLLVQPDAIDIFVAGIRYQVGPWAWFVSFLSVEEGACDLCGSVRAVVSAEV